MKPYFHGLVIWMSGRFPPHYRHQINQLSFIRIAQKRLVIMSSEIEFACKLGSSPETINAYLLEQAFREWSGCTKKTDPKDVVREFCSMLFEAFDEYDVPVPQEVRTLTLNGC